MLALPVGYENPYALNTPRHNDRKTVSTVTDFSYTNVIFVNIEVNMGRTGNISSFMIQLVIFCSQECKNVYSGIL